MRILTLAFESNSSSKIWLGIIYFKEYIATAEIKINPVRSNPMEIKELIPKSKEILIQPKTQEGVFNDAFSYIIQNPNSNKSYLYIVSQVQSKDSSLDYAPNLIASFIKRELESGNGSIADEKQVFENALKKTNELIEGLVKNNEDIKLDLGVAFLKNEKISVSKIGKAKLLAYREGKDEIFDVFENITQFNKSHLNSKRFSSIISGEIKRADKFFFLIPNLRLNLKQKLIKASLCKSGREEFAKDLHKIIAPRDNKKDGAKEAGLITCCGIYFEIKEEIKKIDQEKPAIKETTPALPAKETQITATEVSKIDKGDIFKKTAGEFKNMILGESLNGKKWSLIKNRNPSGYVAAAAIALLVVAGVVIVRQNTGLKEELASINEKLRTSESRFLLKQNYEARKILSEAFQELNLLKENREKNQVLLAAVNMLYRMEKVDAEVKPNILLDLAPLENLEPEKLKNVLAGNGKIFINDAEKIYQVEENQLKPVEESGDAALIWIKDSKIISAGANIKIIDLEENKIRELAKKFSFEPVEMKNYEDNLYFLGSKNIYKISNALVNPIEEFEWLKPSAVAGIPGNFISFDLDSNIYALTDERKLITLFKGGVAKSTDLDFDVTTAVKLVNLGNNEFLVMDKNQKLVRAIDGTGNLKVSYDLSDIEAIKDFYFDKQNSILYILAPTKIWTLKI